MSTKIEYWWTDGLGSQSTAYLDCDIEVCPHEVHTGEDKYTDDRCAVVWDDASDSYRQVPYPDHTCDAEV